MIPAFAEPNNVERVEPIAAELVIAAEPAVASATDVSEAVDSIMAEWDAANWWDSNSREASAEDASFAAAAVGFVALGTSIRPSKRRRDSSQ